MKQSLAVLFPGTGDTCGEPLMQKIARHFLEAGYQVVQLDFRLCPFMSWRAWKRRRSG